MNFQIKKKADKDDEMIKIIEKYKVNKIEPKDLIEGLRYRKELEPKTDKNSRFIIRQ